MGRRALRGLRLVHTHLKEEPLNKDDFTDLALLRFDLIAAISAKDGLPGIIYVAHLMPKGSEKVIEVLPPDNFYSFRLDFDSFIESLEDEMERAITFDQRDMRERVILVSVSTRPKYEQEDSIEELKELARSSNVHVLDSVIQRL
ncbi:MAG: GTPase HflX, partial [Nitrospirota bacterium]|nr:GTPase HflX [Nitrospirota bacterium]